MSRTSHNLNIEEIILKKPRITEKATVLSGLANPVYTFEVPASANKILIKKAVIDRFKVVPVKISIVNLPAKKVFFRRRLGTRSAVKKALVYLKPGQTIDTV